MIINLVKNAVDAAGPDGRVAAHWSLADDRLRLENREDAQGCVARLELPTT